MAAPKKSTVQAENFLRAVLAELGRVVNRDRDAWTVKSRLPVAPHAAQLSVLARLLLKGADEHWRDVFKSRKNLDALLAKAHREIKTCWEDALTKANPEARQKQLNRTDEFRPAVNKAVDFAERAFGLHDMPLIGFTDNVQDTLAGLVGRISAAIEAKLQPGKKGAKPVEVPGAIFGAVTLGVLARGMVGRREMTPKELSAARIAVRLGSQKDETGGPEPKEVKRLRKTLKELGPHLPEQRG